MMVGCGYAHTQTVVLDPAANSGHGSVTTLAQISGSDEIWYDPATGRFYAPMQPAIGRSTFTATQRCRCCRIST